MYFVKYYKSFVDDEFLKITVLVIEYTSKDQHFTWTKRCEQSFWI